ncbi:MAG: ornithine cyclodeaminase family protein [Solirubrobacteraceae bacterium]
MSRSDDLPVFVSGEAVDEVLDLGEAITAVRDAYSTPLESGAAPPRAVARSHGARLRALAAIMPTGDLMGVKLLAQPRSGGLTYLIVLFDQSDGRLLALLDGDRITAVRTAATSAVAVDALAPQSPLRLGMLGSGHEARAHLRALAAIRPIETVSVFSPTPERRRAFAAWASTQLELRVTPVDDPRAAVNGATTVVCAARAVGEVPIIDGNALGDDTLVVSIGSTLPDQRELDVATLARASLIVADLPDEVLGSSGDGIAAAAAGENLAPKTRSLHQLVRGMIGDGDHAGITVFKSVGSAIQDIAVARLALSGARSRGLTAAVPVTLKPQER